MKVIVTDSNNHWLFFGEAKDREEAIREAKRFSEYDKEAELFVYEVRRDLSTKASNRCPHCGYEWVSRVSEPKKCPNPRCQKPLGYPSQTEELP